jgi:hypothetical protein
LRALSSKKAVRAGSTSWAADHPGEGLRMGLGHIVGQGDVEDRLEQVIQLPAASTRSAWRLVAVGEHQPAAGQARRWRRAAPGRASDRPGHVVHLVQERLRVDAVVGHQPGQGGAVLVQVALLQGEGLVARQPG